MSRPPLPPADAFDRWGIDPAWSRLVHVAGNDGITRTWHVLDHGPADPLATIVCVHGNPTWSLYWRSFVARFGDRYRVIAVDQLGMGFSDRLPDGAPGRRFVQRVDDLADVIDALDVRGPVITAAHDWGGPISLGWVLRNTDRVIGVVLCNTGVAVPAGRHAPSLIRLAAAGPVTEAVCHHTRIFVDGTLALSGRRVSKVARSGYRAPYRHGRDRQSIADFVADVPFDDSHPSAASIALVAEGICGLTMPVLLAWGANDPVFNDDFAHDLAERMPHADLQRFARAGHLVVEEVDVAAVVDDWLTDRVDVTQPVAADVAPDAAPALAPAAIEPIWAGLVRRAGDPSPGFVDGATGVATSFADLHDRVMHIAAGLAASGVEPGDRVALLVMPGVDLLATVYACWRAGAVTVIADRGLGLRGLGAAVRAAHVQWVIGQPLALAAARVLRWAPRARMIPVGSLDALGAPGAALPPEPASDDPAAVLYTSGATGPAKGVRYRHGQIAAQRDALAALYGITGEDRLVAAFAPFALYGPALGIASTIPDVDVTRPGTLTADGLAAAVESIDATVVFASPAALANVVRTAGAATAGRLASIRLVLSAGAPVPIATLRAMALLCRNAALRTPYGMTECLPVADAALPQIELGVASGGDGVCVGTPVPGVDVLIAPLGFDASSPVTPVDPSAMGTGAMGEVLVRAPWLSDGYDQLWRTQHAARPVDGVGETWHRTGDVGHVGDDGVLWIEGRSVHVIHADGGPITPVPVEVAVERLDGIERAAAVGVGPVGCQQLAVVVEDASADAGIASRARTSAVREVVPHAVAAVLTVPNLPVDIRHNTKIDRTAVAAWATAVLAGDRARVTW
ncbi:MAG: putative fatty-acid--CoA ligase [Ilumatobacteraceae bacterium]|nr:putative fatty-acid--CoA ligase [Ilumatobacteraceae bacterium]